MSVEPLNEVAAERAERWLLVDLAQADGAVDAEAVVAAVHGHVQLSFQADAAVVVVVRLKACDAGRARVVVARQPLTHIAPSPVLTCVVNTSDLMQQPCSDLQSPS